MIEFGDPRLPQRFWDKVVVDEAGCWLWIGAIVPKGYGHYSHEGRQRGAHCVAWEVLVGPIPEGKEIDHICRVRRCCRPHRDHLEPVTHAENVRRGIAHHSLRPHYARQRAKTHCVNGHEYTEANTYWRTNGRRMCKRCNADAQARYAASRGA